jgi:hypothetical protein
MKFTTTKLADLEKELKNLLRQVQAGKIDKAEAADKILHLREEMDKVLVHLRDASTKLR